MPSWFLARKVLWQRRPSTKRRLQSRPAGVKLNKRDLGSPGPEPRRIPAPFQGPRPDRKFARPVGGQRGYTMVDSQQELRGLMERIRAGSQEAARELCDRYGSHILRVVRRKLDKKLRSKFDSVDFLQSVWTSFFVNPSHHY